MKANVKAGPLITVGMIIKNEERHLRNCLVAIRKLLDQVDGELIIADTGSTDGSVEIAKEFTDQVFHFEWCDDFAAARNAVVKRAHGQWYLSLDADEYLDDDVEDLIQLLTTSEIKKYNTATIVMRNYSGKEGQKENYSDFHAIRLFRRAAGNYFRGKIHEAIYQMSPNRTLTTIAHHYGYAFQSEEEKETKRRRNLALILKEVEEKPEDIRLLLEAAESCYENGEEVEYLERGIELSKKEGKITPFSARCYYLLMKSYIRLNRFEEANTIGTEVLENYALTKNSVIQLDLYFLFCSISMHKNDLKEALNYYRKYEDYLQTFLNGRADQSDMIYIILESNAPWERAQIRNAALRAAIYLDDSDTLNYMLPYIELSQFEPQELINTINSTLLIAKTAGRAELIRTLYGVLRTCAGTDDKELSFKWTTFYYLLERFYLQNPDLRTTMMEVLLECPEDWQQDELISTMQLVATEQNSDFVVTLQQFLAQLKNWNSAWAVVYYLALKYGQPLPEQATIQNKQRAEIVLDHLAASYSDYPHLLKSYHDAMQMEDLDHQQWMVIALEKALLACKMQNDTEFYLKLIELCGNYVNSFIHQLYRPEILCDDAISVLPPMYQFGFYYHRALECRKQGDELGFINNLKTVINHNQHYKDLVEMVRFVIDIQEKQKQEKQREFSQLAVAFIGKVQQLMDMGMAVEARTMLEQYLYLNPQDQEAMNLWNSINVEPKGPIS